jgi:hypothetical protein
MKCFAQMGISFNKLKLPVTDTSFIGKANDA